MNIDRFNRVLTYFLISLVVILIMAPAWAQQPCNGHSCNDGGDNLQQVNINPSDVSIKAGSALSFVHGLGDVDIAQCLGSTQWDTVLVGKQKLVLNQVCMAEFYLKQGRFDLAAQALCNQKEILAEYATEAECETAHDFTPPDTDEETTGANDDRFVEDEIEVVQMAQNSLEQRVNVLEQTPPPQAIPAPVVKGRFSTAQRMAVFEALGIEGDEDE